MSEGKHLGTLWMLYVRCACTFGSIWLLWPCCAMCRFVCRIRALQWCCLRGLLWLLLVDCSVVLFVALGVPLRTVPELDSMHTVPF
jgi:hypothetical protein